MIEKSTAMKDVQLEQSSDVVMLPPPDAEAEDCRSESLFYNLHYIKIGPQDTVDANYSAPFAVREVASRPGALHVLDNRDLRAPGIRIPHNFSYHASPTRTVVPRPSPFCPRDTPHPND